MSLVFTHEALVSAIEPGGTSEWVEKSLLKWVAKYSTRGSDYDRSLLHTGADLSPDACARKTWYGLHDAPRDPMDVGDAFRLYGGEFWESVMVQAFRIDHPEVQTQVAVRPVRPSSWCWADGRIDVLDPGRDHIMEIKAPRAGLFAYAKSDATRLVKPQYKWQLSRYFHEMKRRGRARTASFLFVDREGSNRPREVAFEGDLVIPVEAIVEREVALAPLLTQQEPPDRIGRTLEVRVWKGPRVKKDETPKRKVAAADVRSWRCNFCEFVTHCQPGPEKVAVELNPNDMRRIEAVGAAEVAWAAGSKRTPHVTRFGEAADPEEGDEAANAADGGDES